MLELVSSMRTRLIAVLLLAAAGGCTPEAANESGALALVPFASIDAPYSANAGIAIVSEAVACVINSFESHVHCVNRTDGGILLLGREGKGPGEFERLSNVERGRDGQVVAVGQKVTFFKPDGSLESETRLPSLFQARSLLGDRLFGFQVVMPDFSAGKFQPGYVPMTVDANSGDVLWERTDVADAVGRECFNGAVSASMPTGGLVFQVCGHELAFFAHRDDSAATVVASPSYVEALPNERDVSAHLDDISGIGRNADLPASEVEAIAAEFREKPKEWILKASPFGFDSRQRLWVATTRDRDAFSYFDVWDGTEYAGAVRVQDRLMGFDILSSTLVTLVERTPGEDGIGRRAIDWYDISKVAW